MLSDDDKQIIQSVIDNEGFDYGFDNWSFDEIEDAEFHRLRKAFIKAMRELESYVSPDE